LTNHSKIEQQLVSDAQILEVSISLAQAKKMLQFLELIVKWNRTHNLTAVKSLDEMRIKHLLDSLSIIKFLPQGLVLDVGSGAGLPGIPLAIALPQQKFHLVDASFKRVAFIQEVKRLLKLDNVSVEHSRVETLKNDDFDVIMSRAFGSLLDFIKKTQFLMAEGGTWLAMKGLYPEQEIAVLETTNRPYSVEKLTVPKLNAERHLVLINKADC